MFIIFVVIVTYWILKYVNCIYVYQQDNILVVNAVSRPVSIQAQYRQLSMSTGKQAHKLSMPNQWAQYRQLSMSTGKQAHKLSIPNQWAHYRQLSMSTGTQAHKLSMPN